MDKINYIWYNNKIIPWDEANIHVMSHILHYGSGVFEGIRCYKIDNCSIIFRLEEHIDRLYNSASLYKMTIPFEKESVIQGCIDIVKKNKFDQCYIRPIAFYGYDTLGVNPKNCPINLAIGVFNWGEYLGSGALTNGVKVTISKWKKFHYTSMPSTAKGCGQYMNSMLAVQDAKARGFDEAILLNHEGKISEGSGQNIFYVKNNELFTNDKSSSILLGITRDCVITLAKELGYCVTIKDIEISDLINADEVFFTGTASEVTPICNIDKKIINSGKPGEITLQLQTHYFKAINGDYEKFSTWLTHI